jgi:hypothetical protein
LGGANEDTCKLGGVLCDRMGYVQQVMMGRRVLDGTLPESFGSLTHLESLDFNTNKLSGRWVAVMSLDAYVIDCRKLALD